MKSEGKIHKQDHGKDKENIDANIGEHNKRAFTFKKMAHQAGVASGSTECISDPFPLKHPLEDLISEGDPFQTAKRHNTPDTNTLSRLQWRILFSPAEIHEYLMLELPRTWQSSCH